MRWYKNILRALKQQPEIWLAYLHGNKIHDLKHLQRVGWYNNSVVMNIFRWGYLLLRRLRLNFSPSSEKCRFLFYAGSINQKNSLIQTIDFLRTKNQDVVAVGSDKIIEEDDGFYSVAYGPKELLKVIFVLVTRGLIFFCGLLKKNRKLQRNRLSSFLEVYNHLVYFDRLLKEMSPEFVIVSNDHNADTRSLLTLAQDRGIKTVYMQHASVSDLFPSLNVDYAFLDGLASLDTYRLCEDNSYDPQNLNMETLVILSGQKKNLELLEKSRSRTVGIALNSLDSIAGAIKLIEDVSKSGFRVNVRWHPASRDKHVALLKSKLAEFNCEYSDPRKESLNKYFSTINCLIASNSSIHLEASISDVVPIYFEIDKAEVYDYYGYVEKGVAFAASDFSALKKLILKVNSSEVTVDADAVRFYSSTYKTPWQNREGELVSKVLLNDYSGLDLLKENVICFRENQK